MTNWLKFGFSLILASAIGATQAAPGDLDSSFGSAGIVLTGVGGRTMFEPNVALQPDGRILLSGAQINLFNGNDIAKAIALQPDGKIVLGGKGMHALVRLTSSGALDPSFGTGGKVLTDFGITSHIHAVAIQSDGKILAVGETYSSTDGGTVALARYNADGSLDTSFGTGGKLQ
jgi:uncharacterized delta-60 repeat protein